MSDLTQDKEWDVSKLNVCFDFELVNIITQMHMSVDDRENQVLSRILLSMVNSLSMTQIII